VFSSEATNLVPDDSNRIRDVFLASTASGAVSRLSRPGAGSKAQGDGHPDGANQPGRRKQQCRRSEPAPPWGLHRLALCLAFPGDLKPGPGVMNTSE